MSNVEVIEKVLDVVDYVIAESDLVVYEAVTLVAALVANGDLDLEDD